jgi:hypothetical protein
VVLYFTFVDKRQTILMINKVVFRVVLISHGNTKHTLCHLHVKFFFETQESLAVVV